MPRYIPGNPTIIVQNMPGGGNVLATNYMFNLAPKAVSYTHLDVYKRQHIAAE